jgi:hypothetical protein
MAIALSCEPMSQKQHIRLNPEREWIIENIPRLRIISDANAKIARLVNAIADGGQEFAEIKDALNAASEQCDQLQHDVQELKSGAVITLHPRIAETYRQLCMLPMERVKGIEPARSDFSRRANKRHEGFEPISHAIRINLDLPEWSG